MARLKLKSVSMRNFGFVRQSSVTFPDSGFVLVVGQNRTGAGRYESIGSGKTLLGEAVSRALFNTPGRFTRYGQFSTNDEGDTYVVVDATLDGVPLKVEQGYKCPELSRSGEGLRFTYGDEPPKMHGNIQNTREDLAQLVGMTPDVAAWTVFLDGDKLNFGALSESSTVNLMMGVLNQPPWTKYQKKASAASQQFTTAVSIASATHVSNISNREAAIFDLSAAKKDLAFTNSIYKELLSTYTANTETRKVRRAEIESSLIQLDNDKRRLKQMIVQIEETVAIKYAALEQKRLDAESDLSRSLAEIQGCQDRLLICSVALEKVHSDEAQAVSDWKQQQYQIINGARNSALEQYRLERASYDLNLAAVAAAKEKIQKAIDRSMGNIGRINLNLTAAKIHLEAKKNAPTTCPVKDCGKLLPLTDADKTAIANFTEEVQRLETELGWKQAEHADLMLGLASLKPAGEQPAQPDTAEQPIPDYPHTSTWALKLSHAEVERQTATVAFAAAYAKRDERLAAIDAIRQEIAALKGANDVSGISRQYELAEAEVTKLGNERVELDKLDVSEKPSDAQVQVWQAKVAERERRVTQCDEALTISAREITINEELVKTADYWVEAFGPTGIPNMIISESIAPLNAISKKISLHMTANLLDVKYDTSRTLASGNASSEIVITATNKYGSAKIAGSSKGENRMFNLIIAETLAEVGQVSSRVGYRWYDEVTGGQEPALRQATFSYLREIAHKLNLLLFVVDHSLEVASYADYVLVAEKTEEGTSYHWQS